MYQLSTTPRDIVQVIKSSIQLYKKVFSKVLVVSIILGVLTAFFGVPVVWMGPPAASQAAPVIHHGGMVAFMLLFFFVSMLLTTYVQCFMLKFEDQIRHDVATSYLSTALFVLRKYFIVLVTMLVVLLAVLLGGIFLIIPGIFVLILLMFAWFAVLIDGDNVFAALKRSVKMVWGNWWRTLIVLLIPGAINGCIILIFRFLLQYGFHIDIYNYWFHVFSAIPVVFMAPWGIAVGLEQYNDLKLRYQRKLEQQSAKSA